MTTKSTKTRRSILKGIAATGAAISMLGLVWSQEKFPNRTIRVVVPFPAGATTDMLARLIAQRMTESLGQNVVIENGGGGGGSIGADQVAMCVDDVGVEEHRIGVESLFAGLIRRGGAATECARQFCLSRHKLLASGMARVGATPLRVSVNSLSHQNRHRG